MTRVMLAVGTAKGAFLFHSDERRAAWRMEGPLFKGWDVSRLTIDRRHEGRLFATLYQGFRGHEIHRSDDDGETWTQVGRPEFSSDLSLNRIWGVFPGHPDEPDEVYAGVDPAGLFVSRDAGATWRDVPGLTHHETREVWSRGYGGLCCHTVRCDPFDADRLWAGISVGGLFRSDDRGETWVPKNRGVQLTIPSEKYPGVCNCIHNLVVSPTVPGRLFQQNHEGLYRSFDGGDSWHRIEEGLPRKADGQRQNFGLPLAGHPTLDPILLSAPIIESPYVHLPVDLGLCLQVSTDSGDSWRPSNAGLPSEGYMGIVLRHALAIDECAEYGAYVGTTSGDLYFSRDRIQTWHTMPGFHCLPRISSVQVATRA